MSAETRFGWAARPAGAGDPLTCLERTHDDAVYLAHPARGDELLGLGAAATIEASGAERFVEARRAAAALFARVDAAAPIAPILMGGFAFHDAHAADGAWAAFPSLSLVLPRLLLVRRGAAAWRIDVAGGRPAAPSRTANATWLPPEDRRERWDARVRGVLADVDAGRLAKLVVSRSRDVDAADVDPIALVRRLRAARPTCTTFLVRRGGAVFLGSTPETLVTVRRGVAETFALAGSMRVGAGEAVETAAARLLACAKNAAEHRHVADAVRAALARVSDAVETTASRAIVRVPEMLHLATGHRARLRAGVSALDAAAALHPTPAVGGVPTAAARARLAVEEPDRGWYTGAVGWIDAAGDGDFAVALRCALVRDRTMRVFAGAGIVAGSEPAAEWDETETKMAAMLRLVAERARAA